MFFLLPTVGSLVDTWAYLALYLGGIPALGLVLAPLAVYSSTTVYVWESPIILTFEHACYGWNWKSRVGPQAFVILLFASKVYVFFFLMLALRRRTSFLDTFYVLYFNHHQCYKLQISMWPPENGSTWLPRARFDPPFANKEPVYWIIQTH